MQSGERPDELGWALDKGQFTGCCELPLMFIFCAMIYL
jgi:hypothetical protein